MSGVVNRPNWTPAVRYAAVLGVLGLMLGSFGPILPTLADNTGVTLAQVGVLFTTSGLGHIVAALTGSRLFDRSPGHTLLASILLSTAVLLALLPVIGSLWLLAVVMFWVGVLQGTIDVGSNTLIFWAYDEDVGPYMALMHFTFGVGALLAPLLVAQMVLRGPGIDGALWLIALLVVPLALWLWRVPSPVMRRASAEKIPLTRGQQIIVGLVALFLLVYVGMEVSYAGWIFSYAQATLGDDVSRAATLNSAFWGALTVGRLLLVPLSTRLRPAQLLGLNLTGALLSGIALWLLPTTPAALWAGTMGLGLFFASIFPVTLMLAEEMIPATGRVTGVYFAGSSTGAMVVPWLVGVLFGRIGPIALIGMELVLLVSALALLAVLLAAARRVGHTVAKHRTARAS